MLRDMASKRIEHGLRQTHNGFQVELYDVLDGFAVFVHLVNERGIPTLAELRVYPVATPPTMGSRAAESFADARHAHFGQWVPEDKVTSLPARHFRDSVKLGDVISRAKAAITQHSRLDPATSTRRYLGDVFSGRPETPADDLVGLIETGTPRDDLHYATLARGYADVVSGGTTQNVYVEMKARGLDYSTSYLRDEIKEARRRKMLTKTPGRGRAGGRLTAKAERILKQAEKAGQ